MLNSSKVPKYIVTNYTHEDLELLGKLISATLHSGNNSELAESLLSYYGSLKNTLAAGYLALTSINGVSEQLAIQFGLLYSTVGVIMRNSVKKRGGKYCLKLIEDACMFASAISWRDRYETLRVITLDERYCVAATSKISDGNMSQVKMNFRRILEPTIISGCNAFIIVHNHPSGVLLPSEDDELSKDMLDEVSANLGVQVLDSIITHGTRAFSMSLGLEFDCSKLLNFNQAQ